MSAIANEIGQIKRDLTSARTRIAELEAGLGDALGDLDSIVRDAGRIDPKLIPLVHAHADLIRDLLGGAQLDEKRQQTIIAQGVSGGAETSPDRARALLKDTDHG